MDEQNLEKMVCRVHEDISNPKGIDKNVLLNGRDRNVFCTTGSIGDDAIYLTDYCVSLTNPRPQELLDYQKFIEHYLGDVLPNSITKQFWISSGEKYEIIVDIEVQQRTDKASIGIILSEGEVRLEISDNYKGQKPIFDEAMQMLNKILEFVENKDNYTNNSVCFQNIYNRFNPD